MSGAPSREERDEHGVTCDCLGPPYYVCPHWPARPESGGQQQAVADYRLGLFVQRATELSDEATAEALVPLVLAYAEAARPGQELRERVLRLVDDCELWAKANADLANWPEQTSDVRNYHDGMRKAWSVAADRIRAALEDPR